VHGGLKFIDPEVSKRKKTYGEGVTCAAAGAPQTAKKASRAVKRARHHGDGERLGVIKGLQESELWRI
jgi:hypothetical protein